MTNTNQPDNYERANMSKLGIKWLEILEREFDSKIIELDLSLNDGISSEQELWDNENHSPLITGAGVKANGRQNSLTNGRPPQLSQLSSTFVQLAHKCLLLCDANTSLERELTQVRSQLNQMQTRNESLEKRLHHQQQQQQQHFPLSLQSKQRQFSLNSKLMSLSSTISSSTRAILRKEEEEGREEKEEVQNLRRENHRLRRQLTYLKSDLYAVQLASKYLDKELCGRIQQIQVLSKFGQQKLKFKKLVRLILLVAIQIVGNDDLKNADRAHLWNQIEAEVRLNRHKAMMKSCRARAASTLQLKHPNPMVETPQMDNDHLKGKHSNEFGHSLPEVREIFIQKQPDEPLGIKITGGKEHGIPILISEIRAGSAASRCGQLYVGDAILGVNDISLNQHTHSEAAKVLTEQRGDCRLRCVFVPPDAEEENRSDDQFEHGFRNFFELESTTQQINGPSVLMHLNEHDHDESPTEDDTQDDRMSSVTDALNVAKLYPGSARPLQM